MLNQIIKIKLASDHHGGVIAVIIFVVAIILRSESSQVPPLSAARLASDPLLGSPSAKVTIIEYGDFGCPTCRGWSRLVS